MWDSMVAHPFVTIGVAWVVMAAAVEGVRWVVQSWVDAGEALDAADRDFDEDDGDPWRF
jgi:hypothetical protein